MKNIIIELKNTLDLFNNTLGEAGENISQLKGKAVEFNQAEQQTEKKKKEKNKGRLRNLWNDIRWTNIIMEFPGGEERGREAYQ